MEPRRNSTSTNLVALIFVLAIGSLKVAAQQPPSVPSSPDSASITNIERRVYQIETTQKQTIESLKSSNEYNRFLITVVSAIVALLVLTQSLIQGFTTFQQTRRQKERDQHQLEREKERDESDRTGVEQVSKIMSVVQQTLESRLDAEKKAREEAVEARGKLGEVLDHIKSLEQFYNNFQKTIHRARQFIEDSASRWAQEVARHDFRRMAIELNSFAQQFDKFATEFEDLEETSTQFSPRVPYIRGIAAHYANQPDLAEQYLKKVVAYQSPEAGEIEIAFKRRVANAYYYLGLIASNFGNNQNAIEFFEIANKLDLQGRDFLTRVVTAEAYMMSNDLDKARALIKDIEDGLSTIERNEGRLRNFHLRLQSRAMLLKANIVILGRDTNWHEETKNLLRPVIFKDPQYYYLTATLAQIYADQGDSEHAEKIFREAYESIERSGDLLTVTEVRSKILLLTVAAMCCKHGLSSEKRSEEHLDKADGLRASLPKIGPQACTVFSTLSKRNENSETIHYHIELIQKGKLFLESNR